MNLHPKASAVDVQYEEPVTGMCVKCGSPGRVKAFNIDGKKGVPVCLDCRREWFLSAVEIPSPL